MDDTLGWAVIDAFASGYVTLRTSTSSLMVISCSLLVTLSSRVYLLITDHPSPQVNKARIVGLFVTVSDLRLTGIMAAIQPGAANAGGVRGNANIPGLQQWIMEIPPVTRAWIIGSVAISMAVVSLVHRSFVDEGCMVEADQTRCLSECSNVNTWRRCSSTFRTSRLSRTIKCVSTHALIRLFLN